MTATGQSITASDNSGGNTERLSGLIEINAGIQPGDSGGALVNTSSHVIGMDTAASTGTAYQVTTAQAYAIPISTALHHRPPDRGGSAEHHRAHRSDRVPRHPGGSLGLVGRQRLRVGRLRFGGDLDQRGGRGQCTGRLDRAPRPGSPRGT